MKDSEERELSCKSCNSKELNRIISRVNVVLSEDTRLERLADPSRFGGFDENDPKSMVNWMKKMGKELGEDLGDDFDQVVEETIHAEEKRTTVSENQESSSVSEGINDL